MSILYLMTILITMAGQSIAKKEYAKRGTRSVFLFNMVSALAAVVFFILTSKEITWNSRLIPYSFFFALSYAASCVFGILAVATGPLSLTSLIVSYSLLIPTVYGLTFLKDPIGVGLIPGIFILLISLALINKKDEKIEIQPKWILFVSLSAIGNGMCSTVQKIQQVEFGGDYKNEFMIIALLMVCLLFAVIAFFKKETVGSEIKISLICGGMFGVLNGIMNLFVMILSGKMPVSLMFPVISAGQIIVTYLMAKTIYKEILSRKQLYGLIAGIISIVFLNI